MIEPLALTKFLEDFAGDLEFKLPVSLAVDTLVQYRAQIEQFSPYLARIAGQTHDAADDLALKMRPDLAGTALFRLR